MFGKPMRKQWMSREVWIAAIALVAGLLVSQAFAVEPPASRKMARQIDVMERIVDQVLIDSPNFLVSGRGTTRGLYIGDYGVIFTFSASLVNKGKSWNFNFGDGFKIERGPDGDDVIIIDPHDFDFEDEDDEEYEDEDEEDDRGRRTRPRRGGRGGEAEERLYKRGKAELVDLFLDYGDTMTTLEKGQQVAVVAFLGNSSFFDDQRISRLVLKAKIDDLRAYAAEKLSEKDMVSRITEEEY